MSISVIIVTWNSERRLPLALRSLAAQTMRDFSVIVVDNASSDRSVAIVREECPGAAVIRNSRNLGLDRGWNQALSYVGAHLAAGRDDHWVLLVNDDAVLAPDFVERIMNRVERRPDIGSATGLVCRATDAADDFGEPVMTEVIDTAGLRASRSRRFSDRGAGLEVTERFLRLEEVFGVSGCVALFRWSALEEAKVGGEWFDGDFYMYREDTDLAWRLRLFGWKSLYVPEARAWHFRTAAASPRRTVLGEIRRRRLRSRMVQCKSFRNHLLTMVKNDRPADVLRDAPWIFGEVILQSSYLLLFQPRAWLCAWREFFALLPAALHKRRAIMRRTKADRGEMRRWLVGDRNQETGDRR
jgi:GT2 family glycosyltransferase